MAEITPSISAESAPIKVLRIITRMNIGGPAVQVSGLMQGMDKAVFNQELVTGRCLDNEVDYLESKLPNLKVTRIETLSRRVSIFSDISTLLFLIKKIREFKPDIIHTHLAKAGVIGRVASLLSGHKSIRIHTYHGHLLTGYFTGYKLALLIFVEKFLAKVTHHLVAVGEKVKEDLIEVGIGSRAKFSVVNPGVQIQPLPDKQKVLTKLDLDQEIIYCAFIGRLTKIKRPDRMLEVASELKNRNINIHFIVAGGGELLAECKNIALKKNLPVTFLGWQEDIEEVLAISDLVLLTSDNEGTPIALIQSGMAGITSVSTNVGSIAEVVVNNQTGLITDFSVKNIADALEKLVSNSQLRKQYGQAASQFCLGKFHTEIMISNYSKLYKQLILKK
jgi:glycosyltransferase involved in cell wall biosynthesis